MGPLGAIERLMLRAWEVESLVVEAVARMAGEGKNSEAGEGELMMAAEVEVEAEEVMMEVMEVQTRVAGVEVEVRLAVVAGLNSAEEEAGARPKAEVVVEAPSSVEEAAVVPLSGEAGAGEVL